MKNPIVALLLVSLLVYGCQSASTKNAVPADQQAGWYMLFNGKDLTGWKAAEKPGCFTVENGAIKVHDGRSHLFYVGPVQNADFKNFEFSAQVMTTPQSNSGIYFHTEYQQTDWPKKGYESQVNISHPDPQKSGGLYDAAKVNLAPAQDNQWYSQYILVKGKHVVVKINGHTVVDYTEPENVNFPDWPGRRLSHGTFALQGHDPQSVVYFKDIRVRPLP